MSTSEEILHKAIVEKARQVDGKTRLRCKDALELAAQLDCPPASIRAACDALKIKICACQLGCF